MNRYLLPAAAVVATLLAACGTLPAPQQDATTARNRATMLAFDELLYGQKQVRAAYEKYVAVDLVQHSPSYPDGRAGTMDGLQKFYGANPQARFIVRRLIVEGDLAAVHYEGKLSPGTAGAAVVEIFRLQNGKIVEHWDVFQGIPAVSLSGRPVVE
jgi:predicted SnoaL-like aldol condensation-catalyzing enzyme